jgi:hypothetical protein
VKRKLVDDLFRINGKMSEKYYGAFWMKKIVMNDSRNSFELLETLNLRNRSLSDEIRNENY